jgi:predicted nuclease of predicted toxin-antitoxin system
MKLKLDENLGRRVAALFRQQGHDVSTVPAQGFCSAHDRVLIETCRSEQRCLVTLDLEFGNSLLFRPSAYAGIAVLRLPPKPTPEDLVGLVETLLDGLAHGSLEGKLWIVQRGRIREYQEPDVER